MLTNQIIFGQTQQKIKQVYFARALAFPWPKSHHLHNLTWCVRWCSSVTTFRIHKKWLYIITIYVHMRWYLTYVFSLFLLFLLLLQLSLQEAQVHICTLDAIVCSTIICQGLNLRIYEHVQPSVRWRSGSATLPSIDKQLYAQQHSNSSSAVAWALVASVTTAQQLHCMHYRKHPGYSHIYMQWQGARL